jgi:CheY-like chemotaxis protein
MNAVNDKSILVVEDEPVILRMVVAIIEDMGFGETYTALDGETALRVFEERHPTIVLTDVRLPGMDGLELTRRIKSEDESGTPVLLMSAHGEPSAHEGDGFLPKPFDVDQFAGFVKRYVGAKGEKRAAAPRRRRQSRP